MTASLISFAPYERPESSNAFFKMVFEVKSVVLCDAQLAVVVVKSLLGNPEEQRSLWKSHPFAGVERGRTCVMESSPLPHQLDGLSDRPFLAPVLPAAALPRSQPRCEPNQHELRLQHPPFHSSLASHSQEAVARRVVYLQSKLPGACLRLYHT